MGYTQWRVVEAMREFDRPVTITDLKGLGLTHDAVSSALFRLIRREMVRPTKEWKGVGYPRTWELTKWR